MIRSGSVLYTLNCVCVDYVLKVIKTICSLNHLACAGQPVLRAGGPRPPVRRVRIGGHHRSRGQNHRQQDHLQPQHGQVHDHPFK